MHGEAFQIDWNETFPPLAHAPIVEAAIQWQARPQQPLNPTVLPEELSRRLPEFNRQSPIQQVDVSVSLPMQPGNQPAGSWYEGWSGIRLATADEKYVALFQPDGLTFSRMAPYEDWERFTAMAKRAWQVFRDLAAPLDIQRLGVRFINHLPSVTPGNVRDYLREPPTCLVGLPLKQSIYQSTFSVPGQPINIRIIQLLQSSSLPHSAGLFLDCEAFTMRPLDIEKDDIDDTLGKMRWLKNKLFFSLLADRAIESLKEGNVP